MNKKIISFFIPSVSAVALLSFPAAKAAAAEAPSSVTLRVCNWEEYIDTGDWSDEDTISLESGDITSDKSMIDAFEDWYYETYGIHVNVEYSTFGTNEDLYNRLMLGDTYDLVCPSEYLIMKLMLQNELVPLSDNFFDTSIDGNYYIKGVSPYINSVLSSNEINNEPWSKYMAGYMWGITGIVYNPEYISKEEASTWTILDNPQYKRQVTIKDNVRDSYFAAVGALKHDLLTSDEFVNSPDYKQKLVDEMNDVSDATIADVQDYLQSVKNNAYSFETDSGKSDMITGKVLANYQWSGDAVYTMDQADEDDYTLNFAVPTESSNIYFDGWVMLKKGISSDTAKQHAAEAFINFLSRPDNAIRNMSYIGYTSAISGGDDKRIFEYADYCYGAEDDDEDTTEYSISYFFSDDSSSDEYTLTVNKDSLERQLAAQYPSEETLKRTCVMLNFDNERSSKINQMWINVRCFNIHSIPIAIRILICIGIATFIGFLIKNKLKH